MESGLLLVFRQVSDWAERLSAATEPVCLRAMRTQTETLDLQEAGRRARSRMSRISRKRARTRLPQPPGDLFLSS